MYDQMYIFVELVQTCQTITLDVESWYTVDNVKAAIQNYEPIISEHYSIIFDGTKMDDLQTLADYKIDKGSTLLLEKHTLMHIYVEFDENIQMIPLEVESWYTINDVKAEIEDYEPIVPEHCCITFDGTKLDDFQTLADYNIEKGSTLLLENGTMQITVNQKESDGGTIFTIIYAASWDRISDVKAKIEKKAGILQNQQILYLEHMRLEDGCTLADYGILGYTTLDLLEMQFQIFIKTLHDKAITLPVERWYTTDNVKADIQNYEPIIPEHYSIIFDGTTLDGLQTLEDYKIGKGSTLLLEKHTLMHVYVELVENCQTIPLEVETWYTADDVKAEIQNYESINPEHYCITFDGTKLDDHQTLVDYKIEKGSTLLLEKGTMQILVNLNESDVGSSFIIIHAASWDTIADVKAKIEKKAGALQDRHTLYFEQMRLEDSCTLADYDIKEDYTTLDLLENQQLQIFVKTLYDRTITLYVESSYTIGEVKSEIQKKGIPPNNYKLFFEGTVLEIWCSLSVYDIPDKSILDLVPIPQNKRKKDY